VAENKTILGAEANQGLPLAGLGPELAARVRSTCAQLPPGFRWPRILLKFPPRQRAVAVLAVAELARRGSGAKALSARSLAAQVGVSHTLARRVLKRLVAVEVLADITQLADPRPDRQHQGRARLFVLLWDPFKFAEVETPLGNPQRNGKSTPPSAGTRPGPRPASGRPAAREFVTGHRWILWRLKGNLRALPRLHRDALATALYRLQAWGELNREACARLVQNLPPLLARGRPGGRNPRRIFGWAARIVHQALALPRPEPRPARRASGPRWRNHPVDPGQSASACSSQAVVVRLPVEGAPGYLAIEFAPAGGTLAVARAYIAHCLNAVGTGNLDLLGVRLEERWADGRRLGVWAVWPGGELPLRRIPPRELRGYKFGAVSPLNPGDRRLRILVWIGKNGSLRLEWWRGRGKHRDEYPRSATFRAGHANVKIGRRLVRLLPPRQWGERMCRR